MTAEDVHDALGSTGATGQVVLADGTRASVEDYAVREGLLHVEYDRPGSRSDRRVVTVRQPLRASEETATLLLTRLGEPIAGREALDEGLQLGPAIWIDRMCDVVVTYYRREAWPAEVSTYLRVESLSRLPAESPAAAVVREHLANGTPVPAAEEPPRNVAAAGTATAEIPLSAPPRRTEYSAPDYPALAKQQGVEGVVTLKIFVQRNGKVAIARVVSAEPRGYGFETAAVEAAYRWRFIPGSLNGRPVDGNVEMVVRFP
jgi:TonB family protein